MLVAPRIVNDVSCHGYRSWESFSVAGAVFGDLGASLFAAGAVFGEMRVDSRLWSSQASCFSRSPEAVHI